MPDSSPAIVGIKSSGKSAVSNGSRLLPGVDGRSVWVRRCRDLIEAHVSDLGGITAISEAERSIVRRASVLTVELERMEKNFATAGEADDRSLDLYQKTAGSLRRLLETVGIERRARSIGSPTLLGEG